MAYRIHSGESPPSAIHRIAREQLERAHAELTGKASDPLEAIHDARRRFKKFRAILRLIEAPLGAAFEPENAWHRDLGRDLSRVRDATMLVEALDALAAARPKRIERTAWRELRDRLERRRERIVEEAGDLREEMNKIAGRLAAAARRAARWPLKGLDGAGLAAGFRRCYACGCRALRSASRAPSDERIHELRKRAKDHLFQVQMLAAIWPEALPGHRKELKRLASLLGDAHDLSVLRRTAKEIGVVDASGGKFDPLLELIDKQYDRLAKQGLDLARSIYAEKPGTIGKRLEQSWRTDGRLPRHPDAS